MAESQIAGKARFDAIRYAQLWEDADVLTAALEHRPGAKAVDWATPIRSRTQIDRVVVSVCEPEPKQDAPGRRQPERVDELLSHEAHRRRAEDDHSLLVQSNDALIRPKIKQLGEVQLVAVRRVVAAGLGLHRTCHSMA